MRKGSQTGSMARIMLCDDFGKQLQKTERGICSYNQHVHRSNFETSLCNAVEEALGDVCMFIAAAYFIPILIE